MSESKAAAVVTCPDCGQTYPAWWPSHWCTPPDERDGPDPSPTQQADR